jgi:selT/selW/selH-like putative selenoprotein
MRSIMNLKQVIWLIFFLGFTYELVLPYTRPRIHKDEEAKPSEDQEPPQVRRAEVFENDGLVFEAMSSSRDSFRYPLVIAYCQSCSYKAKVDEVRLAALNQFPLLSIVEEDYPATFPWNVLASIIGILRFAGLVMMFAGEWVFQKLNMPPPQIYHTMQNNKLLFGAFLFMGLNAIQTYVGSSGAFEVLYDGRILFSKLHTGRMPTTDLIMKIVGELTN